MAIWRKCSLSVIYISCLVMSVEIVKGQYQDRFCSEQTIDIVLEGEIGRRMTASYLSNILQQDIDHLISPFHKRDETQLWQSEFWGKWMTSAILAYRYQSTPELAEKLRYAVDELLKTQTQDGYIGNYAFDYHLQEWDIWGRKYCMLGLLEYYALTGERNVLNATCHLADHLIRELRHSNDGLIVSKGNYRGMAASSVLEPICRLYSFTLNSSYLEFAKEIVRQWDLDQGPHLIGNASVDVAKRFAKPSNWFGWEQGQKAYEMMSCYEGLLELYRITGINSYREAVEKAWQNIFDTEINIVGSGSSGEMWFGGRALQAYPIYHYQETCVTVTWLKLSHQLLRLTGNPKYADAVEKTFFNALLGAMSPDASRWAKYTPLTGKRLPGSGQCGMNINCCEANGPRGLFNIPIHVIMAKQGGFVINYYMAGSYGLRTSSGQYVSFRQTTQYPTDGNISLEIEELEKEEDFVLDVRIPNWSTSYHVQVNGDTLSQGISGNYLSIQRKWRRGDKVVIQFNLRGKLEYLTGSAKHVAISYGPVILALDSRYIGTEVASVVSPVVNSEGFVELELIKHDNRNAWLEMEALFIPESYTEEKPTPIRLRLCDYASAGYGEGFSIYKVWMSQLINPRHL